MKILLGFGGSDAGWGALERELDRLASAVDRLTVGVVDAGDVDEPPDELARQVRSRLDRLGVEAEVRVLEGPSGPALVEAAEAGGFDRLALAGGRRAPSGKVMLGPAVEYVVLNAPITVVLLR